MSRVGLAQDVRIIWICIATAFAVGACGKVGGSSTFTGPALVVGGPVPGPSALPVSSVLMDAGAFDVNNDQDDSCTAYWAGSVAGTGALLGVTDGTNRGCMQNPAIAYSDSRFFVGFPQNFIAPTATNRYGILSAQSSPVSGLFASVGSALGLIDAGLSTFAWSSATQISSRYVRYATFPNGNVIAVYMVEVPLNTNISPLHEAGVKGGGEINSTRAIYASIYQATSHSWTAAQLLGTVDLSSLVYDAALPVAGKANLTDFGSDYVDFAGFNYWSLFCRPAVATSGDNSAMVAWCEQPNGLVNPSQSGEAASQIMYARYVNGAWQRFPVGASTTINAPLVTTPTLVGNQAPPMLNWYNAIQTLFASNPTLGPISSVTLGVGDMLRLKLYTNSTKSTYYSAYVKAVNTTPTSGQFLVNADPAGNVQMCATLQNMIVAMLSVNTFNQADEVGINLNNSNGATPAVPTRTPLGRQGVTLVLDPNCDPAVPETWSVTAYINRTLAKNYRNVTPLGNTGTDLSTPVDGSANTDFTRVLESIRYVQVAPSTVAPSDFDATAATLDPASQVPRNVASGKPNQDSWIRSAAVDLAGDGFGNYMLARTAVSPFFQDVSTSSVNGTALIENNMGKARALVGHQFNGATGSWLQRNGKIAGRGNEPEASFLSNGVTCQTGSADAHGIFTYVPCSVRNPRALMSSAGKGVVLFYQNQVTNPTPGAFNPNPNRLWWANFGTATGFGSAAAVLDQDVFCSTGSVANDASVCETASYDAVGASGTFNYRCQNINEIATATTTVQAPVFTNQVVTHDVPPIAAMMNTSGQALVAYHKSAQGGSVTNPTCPNVGTYVVTYDPVNGFGDTTLVSAPPNIDGTAAGGDTMHASVYVTPQGNMGVTWEEVLGTARFVYMRLRINGVWGPQIQMNDSTQQDAADSMMPSVGLNDKGEAFVTYTYGPAASLRRQYVKYYYYQ